MVGNALVLLRAMLTCSVAQGCPLVRIIIACKPLFEALPRLVEATGIKEPRVLDL